MNFTVRTWMCSNCGLLDLVELADREGADWEENKQGF